MSELWYSEFYTENLKFTFRVKEVLLKKQTKFQTLEILDTYEFGRMMLLDGKVMLTEADEFIYHEMMVHPAVLLHPSPKRVLIIGGGDGGIVRELVKYKEIERIVLVDIDAEVVEASKRFLPQLSSGLDDPRVEIRIEEGSRFVREEKRKFDIVYIDSTDPVGPGPIGPAETLITPEFLKSVKAIMREEGIYVAQSESPVYQREYLKNYIEKLKKLFNTVKPYFIMVPSFSGLWSITFASSSISPYGKLRESPLSLRYFTPEILKASFQFGEAYLRD